MMIIITTTTTNNKFVQILLYIEIQYSLDYGKYINVKEKYVKQLDI